LELCECKRYPFEGAQPSSSEKEVSLTSSEAVLLRYEMLAKLISTQRRIYEHMLRGYSPQAVVIVGEAIGSPIIYNVRKVMLPQ
jgi:hypothetical protein